jgi:hypothetical protein
VQEALQGVVGALRRYKESRVLDTEEAALFQGTCIALTATLCPFVAECFCKIFPSYGQLLDVEKLAAFLGTPTPTSGEIGLVQSQDLQSRG